MSLQIVGSHNVLYRDIMLDIRIPGTAIVVAWKLRRKQSERHCISFRITENYAATMLLFFFVVASNFFFINSWEACLVELQRHGSSDLPGSTGLILKMAEESSPTKLLFSTSLTEGKYPSLFFFFCLLHCTFIPSY